MMHGLGDGYGMWYGGGIVMILFWVLVIAGVVWLVRLLVDRADPSAERSDRALEILEARFARGEISAEEFRSMREELAGRKR